MISFDDSPELAALDGLLMAEFEADYESWDSESTEALVDEEPLPVSSFRQPVLAPDVLSVPEEMVERMEMHLAEIGLRERTVNVLEEGGLHLVGELLSFRPDQLLTIEDFGKQLLDEVYRALARLGFVRPGRPVGLKKKATKAGGKRRPRVGAGLKAELLVEELPST